MHLRRFVLCLALPTLSAPASALEKISRPAVGFDRLEAWSSGPLNTIAYYNTCTGWIWTWSGFQPGERIGVYYETQPIFEFNHFLETSSHFVFSGAPSGYGYTGTLEIRTADAAQCPGPVRASQPWLPVAGWNEITWNHGLPPQGPLGYDILYTMGPGVGSPLSFATDHPAAGPTGPPACGTCYPSTRVTRSYFFGTESSPLCPGTRFDDSVCPAELLWEIAGHIIPAKGPVSIESTSWANIKAMYR
jgi:hypothetical protein